MGPFRVNWQDTNDQTVNQRSQSGHGGEDEAKGNTQEAQLQGEKVPQLRTQADPRRARRTAEVSQAFRSMATLAAKPPARGDVRRTSNTRRAVLADLSRD